MLTKQVGEYNQTGSDLSDALYEHLKGLASRGKGSITLAWQPEGTALATLTALMTQYQAIVKARSDKTVWTKLAEAQQKTVVLAQDELARKIKEGRSAAMNKEAQGIRNAAGRIGKKLDCEFAVSVDTGYAADPARGQIGGAVSFVFVRSRVTSVDAAMGLLKDLGVIKTEATAKTN